MDDAEAREAIRGALADVAPGSRLDEVAPDAPLRRALDLDSLDFLALVETLFDRTGVAIPEVDYERVATLTELSSYLVAKSP